MIEIREKRADSTKDQLYSSLKFEDYYEIIKELSTALLNIKGLKTLSHKTLFEEISNNIIFFTIEEKELMDQIRKYRNKVVYEGFIIKSSYLDNNIDSIKSIIEKLKIEINRKLN